MPSLSTKANRFYPSLPEVTADTLTHTNALQRIKEALQTHERRDNNYLKSFIRFEELVELGIIDADGELVLSASSIAGASNTLDGLTDTNLTDQSAGDLLYNNDGTEWRDTAGDLVWDPINDFLQLAGSHSINWLDSLSASIEFLSFNVPAPPPALSSWPEITSFNQQDTAEWVQTESAGFRFNDGGTRAYRGMYNNSVGSVFLSSVYSSPYVPTDSNPPTDILIVKGEVNDIAFNDDGTKVFIARDDTGEVEERTNIGTPFNPGVGDIETVTNTFNPALFGVGIASVEFSSDGMTMYVTGRSAVVGCVQVALSTPWDLSTAGVETDIDFTDMGAQASYCLRIAPDGLKFYVGGTAFIYEYDCTVAFDVTGSSVYTGRFIAYSTEVPGVIEGFDVSPDGTTLIAAGTFGNNAFNNDTNRFTSVPTTVVVPGLNEFNVGNEIYSTRVLGTTITFHDEYTFPIVDGAADQALVTDGAGQLSFVDIPSFSFNDSDYVHILGFETILGTKQFNAGVLMNSVLTMQNFNAINWSHTTGDSTFLELDLDVGGEVVANLDFEDGSEGGTATTNTGSAGVVTFNGTAEINGASSLAGAFGVDVPAADTVEIDDGSATLPWNCDSGDYTVHFLWEPQESLGGNRLMQVRDSVSTLTQWGIRQIFGNIELFAVNVQLVAGTTPTSNGTTYHIAFTKKDDIVYLFVDGNLEGSFDATATVWGSDGEFVEFGEAHNAYWDNIQIIKGEALWTSNFTPPTTISATDTVTNAFNVGDPEFVTHLDGLYVEMPNSIGINWLSSAAVSTELLILEGPDDDNIASVTFLLSGETGTAGLETISPEIGPDMDWVLHSGSQPATVDGEVSTAQANAGTKSLYWKDTAGPNAAGWQTTAATTVGDFTGDFTMEIDVFVVDWTNQVEIMAKWDFPDFQWNIAIAPGGTAINFQVSTDGSNNVNIFAGAPSFPTELITLNTWMTIAISRVGDNWFLLLNGELSGTSPVNNASVINIPAAQFLVIGQEGAGDGSGSVEAYVDNVRITDGVGRYIAGYTVELPYNGSLGAELFIVGDPSFPIRIDGTALNITAATTDIDGSLNVDGAAVLQSTLNVTGVSTLLDDLDVTGDIIVSGLVDGRDVALDGTNQDAHIADATIHFTEASIDHVNILSIGTNTHAQIDTHIADAAIHFPQVVTATTIQLEDITDAINTDATKVAGLPVYNTDTGLPLWAADDTDGGLWNDATGTLAHTPV